MIRCYITGGGDLAASIARNLAAGTDWIQIREKDLPTRELLELARAALALPNPHGTKILVNTRVDVALAAAADGAHLPAGSPAPQVWRGFLTSSFLFGASCHTVEEVRTAEKGGADYVLFGPVFAPLSKPSGLAPRGLRSLTEAARAVRIPVLALGGITGSNINDCIAAGAAGIAGITFFRDAGQ